MENEIKTDEEELKFKDLLASILSNNVNISNEQYEQLINEVASNYDKNNKTEGTAPSLEERRERIKANYYGTSVNLLFQIMSLVNDFHKFYAPLLEAIAEKVGVEFEKIQTPEEKAMEAAAEYLQQSAREKKAKAELEEKQNLNRQARRNCNKENIIKFEPKDN